MKARLNEAAALIGEGAVFEAETMSGGDLSTLWRLRFASGREAVVKLGGLAGSEAAMLRAMGQAGVSVPPVLAVQRDMLVLGFVPQAARMTSAEKWESLGVCLRKLHTPIQPPRYGWHEDYAFGPVAISNRWAQDWRFFWRDSRLMPCVGFLPRDLALRVARLARHLDRYLPVTPRPVLLHGDLWIGNFIATRASDGTVEAVLIDPACTVGDASADFAMLTLFATPPDVFWQAYGPLPEHYERAINVYRLWPALVHFRLFGENYRAMVEACLDALNA